MENLNIKDKELDQIKHLSHCNLCERIIHIVQLQFQK